jgi:EAL domain-containing protein (putative c-di-GMP-specific phosphodiesterase class I)
MQRLVDQAMHRVALDPTRELAVELDHLRTHGAEVVSEGIETAAALDTIRSLGIPYGQGYFLGRPTRPELIPDHFAHVAARARTNQC